MRGAAIVVLGAAVLTYSLRLEWIQRPDDRPEFAVVLVALLAAATFVLAVLGGIRARRGRSSGRAGLVRVRSSSSQRL